LLGEWGLAPSPATRSALDEAIANVSRLDPRNPYASVFLASIQEDSGRPEAAIRLLGDQLARHDLAAGLRARMLRLRAAAATATGPPSVATPSSAISFGT
jgi:hypothetical protein